MNKKPVKKSLKLLQKWACLLAAGMLGFTAYSQDEREDAVISSSERHQRILDMQPIGYWALDEGEGDVLVDLSNTGNNGVIHHVPWDERGQLLDFTGAYQWLEIPKHAAYHTPTFSVGGWIFSRARGYRHYGMAEGMVFVGDGAGQWARREGPFNLRLKDNCAIEVISDQNPDVLGTLAGRIAVTPGRWEHVMYTFGEHGTGTLYLNGQPVGSRDNISGGLSGEGLLVGADASWWIVHPDGTRSLDGSLRDLVLFDRALTAAEVAQLVQVAKPAEIPPMAASDAGAPPAPASSTSQHLKILADAAQSDEDRARAALGLAGMGDSARETVPQLAELLEGIVKEQGERLPRVEDFLRNALIRAMLDIAPDDARSRQAVGVALAKPMLETLDLQQPDFEPLNSLVTEGRYMDALDKYRALDLDELQRRFFTQGAPQRDTRPERPNERAYTTTTEHNGTIYQVGEGVAWKGVEKISPEDFAAVVARVSADTPEALTWRTSADPHLYRVPITKIDPQGKEQTEYLEGKDFVIGTADAKYRGWSIAVDNDGYIHLTGGKHNTASPEAYIPGSWQKIGASTNPGSADYPHQMYWVSDAPGSLQFEFTGQRGNPRRMPPGYMNYMNFVQDRNGELFMYCRINTAGIQSMGLYRYDTKSQRWLSIAGDPYDLIVSARETNPEWMKFLHSQRRGGLPRQSGDAAFVWAWQPSFYNYCRSVFGIKFDPSNRMHVLMRIRGLAEDARLVDGDVYAWSDDLGQTFHRADGTPVQLPLTLNPVPTHNADLEDPATKERWDLWVSLIRDAGFSVNKW
jgi:hypothetical protein